MSSHARAMMRYLERKFKSSHAGRDCFWELQAREIDGVLQCVAVCCSVLQCGTTAFGSCRSARWIVCCGVVCSSMLQCAAVGTTAFGSCRSMELTVLLQFVAVRREVGSVRVCHTPKGL